MMETTMQEATTQLLRDKVVIVSGVGQGLGAKAAWAIAREGATAVCLARSARFVKNVVADIVAAGGKAVAAPGDISVRADCDRVAALVRDKCGRLDGIVNSAYIGGPLALFADADLQNWRKVMDVNFFGTLMLTQANLPLLSEHGGGAIINVSSSSATRPMAMQGAYSASKAALEFATRQLASELGGRNVRVNTLICGPMMGKNLDQAMHMWAEQKGISYEESYNRTASVMALQRIPDDSEAAEVLVLLLSDRCGVVTGASIAASGGAFIDQKI